jgi:outer membrane protein TolC
MKLLMSNHELAAAIEAARLGTRSTTDGSEEQRAYSDQLIHLLQVQARRASADVMDLHELGVSEVCA